MLPTVQKFHDLMNQVECRILREEYEFGSVLQWINVWDTIGVLGLSTGNREHLQVFGDFIASIVADNAVFSIVPKEMVIEENELSAILRTELRGFELDLVPKEIFKRNPDLEGSLVISHSKIYGAADMTRAGQSKEGWRLVFMEACPLFLSKLKKFPDSHRFEFGSTGLQIWGGSRAPEPPGRKKGNGKNGGSRNYASSGSNNNNNNNNRSKPKTTTPNKQQPQGARGKTP